MNRESSACSFKRDTKAILAADKGGAKRYFRMELSELCFQVDSFVRSKQWYGQDSAKPQTPKNLALSLAIEAAEVLEHFQWSDSADSGQLAGELADVLIYTAQLANVTKIDLESAVRRKLASNQERSWPVKGHEYGGA